MVVIGVIASAIAIPLALIIPWFPSKGSVQAGNISTLYDVLLITTMPIFVLVETVVLFSVWKFRMRPGQEEMDGPPIHGNTRLEVVWTAVPAILIVSLCAYAYSVLRSNEDEQEGRDDRERHHAPVRVRVLVSELARQAGRLLGAVPARGPAGRVQAPLARRDPQLLRPELLGEARRGTRDRHDAAGDARRARHVSGRVHRVVWRRPLADAEQRACADPGRVRKLAEVPADQRPTAARDAARDRDPGGPGLRAYVPNGAARRRAPITSSSSSSSSSTSAAAGKAVFTG